MRVKRNQYKAYKELLVEVLGGECAICTSHDKLEIDHIIPYHKGGRNFLSNVQLLCTDCHDYKTFKVDKVHKRVNKLARREEKMLKEYYKNSL